MWNSCHRMARLPFFFRGSRIHRARTRTCIRLYRVLGRSERWKRHRSERRSEDAVFSSRQISTRLALETALQTVLRSSTFVCPLSLLPLPFLHYVLPSGPDKGFSSYRPRQTLQRQFRYCVKDRVLLTFRTIYRLECAMRYLDAQMCDIKAGE